MMNWTIHDIEVLLHHHCSTGKWPLGTTPAYDESLSLLYETDLLHSVDGITRSTARGAAMIEMICDTPLPSQAFIDPRTGKKVEARP